MSNIAIFKQGQQPRYLKSVHTPDYDQDPDVVVNPDVSALDAVPLKYWKRSGDTVSEMSAVEKQAIDDAEKAIRTSRIERMEDIDAVVLAKALVRSGVVSKTVLIDNIKEIINE